MKDSRAPAGWRAVRAASSLASPSPRSRGAGGWPRPGGGVELQFDVHPLAGDDRLRLGIYLAERIAEPNVALGQKGKYRVPAATLSVRVRW